SLNPYSTFGRPFHRAIFLTMQQGLGVRPRLTNCCIATAANGATRFAMLRIIRLRLPSRRASRDARLSPCVVVPKANNATSALRGSDRGEVARFCEDEESRRRSGHDPQSLGMCRGRFGCSYVQQCFATRLWFFGL